ncbi:MAG: transglutaminase-like domain-containing protein [Endomicrobiales bacterium]
MKKFAILVVGVLLAQLLGAVELYENDVSEVRFNASYRIKSSPETRRLRLTVLVPKTIEGRQEITGIHYSLPPARVFESGGNRYAEFDLSSLPRDVNITVSIDARLYRYDFAVAGGNPGGGEAGELPAYLRTEPYLEVDYPGVAEIAGEIPGPGGIETVRQVYDFVTARLGYRGYVREETGALESIRRAYGDCSDFSDVMVTLLRAKGVPARTVDGYLMDYGNDTPLHTWVEAYTPEHGWVPFDPLLGHLKKVSFDRLYPNYLYLSSKRHDDVLRNFHFYSCSYISGSVSIKESYKVEKMDQIVL